MNAAEEKICTVKTRQNDCREAQNPSVIEAKIANHINQKGLKVAMCSVIVSCVLGAAAIIASVSIAAFWTPSNADSVIKNNPAYKAKAN
jgi:hypothetical protein